MIYACLIVGAAVGVALQTAGIVFANLDVARSGCTCRRYAWDPRCPVHGTEKQS